MLLHYRGKMWGKVTKFFPGENIPRHFITRRNFYHFLNSRPKLLPDILYPNQNSIPNFFTLLLIEISALNVELQFLSDEFEILAVEEKRRKFPQVMNIFPDNPENFSSIR